MIEKVRNEAPELRELEQKLRAAYMNQERRKQLQEKVVMVDQEKEREAIVDLQMEAARLRETKAEQAKEGQRRTEALAAKQILKEQMAEQDEAKAAAYAEFIKEKVTTRKKNRERERERERLTLIPTPPHPQPHPQPQPCPSPLAPHLPAPPLSPPPLLLLHTSCTQTFPVPSLRDTIALTASLRCHLNPKP